MEKARNKKTGEEVYAEDLLLYESVDKEDFICAGCNIRVCAASYRKSNKKRPYFKTFPNVKHEKGCSLVSEEYYYSLGNKESISTDFGFPFPYPSKLINKHKKSVRSDDDSKSIVTEDVFDCSDKKNISSNCQYHNRTVYSIKPIVRCYIDFPYDRHLLPLNIEGVAGSSYYNIFQKLYWKEDGFFYKKLFYAPFDLRNRNFYIENNVIKIPLFEGFRKKESNGRWVLERPFTLLIDVSSWSEKESENILNQIRWTKNEYSLKIDKNRSDLKGWVFFIGVQDDDDKCVFHANNYNGIYITFDEVVYVKKPDV